MNRATLSSLAAVLLSAASAPVLAQDAAGGPAALDRELQGLKAEGLALNRSLADLQAAQSFPPGSRASVYVGMTVPGFLLDTVKVQLDGKELASYAYSGSEARALQKNGWHRLKDMALEAGPHRIQASFTGHYWNAPQGEPPLAGQAEGTIDKAATDIDVALAVTRASLHDKPALSAPAVVPAASAGSDGDPRYRAALFFANDNRYVSALTELLAVNATDAAPAALQALRVAGYTGYGMDDAAQQADRKLAATSPDAIVAMRPRLDLARLEYDRGRGEAAAQSLASLRGRVPAAMREEWRTASAETLLSLGRNADVVALLGDDRATLTPGQRYNLGVALIGSGRTSDGLHEIEAVGTAAASGTDALALRDKANLILGYQYLQAQNGEAAQAAFRRVRPQGPFSNRAMLGLGWAEVARAAGEPSAEIVQRALVPWVELIKRDPMDPAVEEGFLASAWSLERLHSDEQAIAYYQRATAALEQARARIQEARKAIRNGSMLYTMIRSDLDSERGWKWQLTNLADTPETYFLQKLLAQHRFEEVLKDYRDALQLGRMLTAWKARLDAPRDLLDRIERLVPRLEANANAQRRLLDAMTTAELDGQQQQVERYLAESRSAVARLYERQIEEAK